MQLFGDLAADVWTWPHPTDDGRFDFVDLTGRTIARGGCDATGECWMLVTGSQVRRAGPGGTVDAGTLRSAAERSRMAP